MAGRRVTEDDVIAALLGPPQKSEPHVVIGSSSGSGAPPPGFINPMTGIGQMIASGEGGALKAIANAGDEHKVIASGAGPDFEPTFQYPRINVQDEGIDDARVETLNFVGAGVTVTSGAGVATITISGGGGGSSLVVQLADSTIVAAADTMDFSASFTLSESPGGEANVGLDYSGGTGSSDKPARQDHTHSAYITNVSDTTTIDLTLAGQTISADFKGLLAVGAAPGTPAAGLLALYAKTGNRLYIKDDTGQEVAAFDEYNALEITIGGGSGAISVGVFADFVVPYDCTVIEWTLLGDQTGSLVLDLWKDTYANFPPTIGDTITGTDKPTISASTKGQSSALTGWTTALSRGDIIRINVDSSATITRTTLVLAVRRT
jgi:hypothetical protein